MSNVRGGDPSCTEKIRDTSNSMTKRNQGQNALPVKRGRGIISEVRKEIDKFDKERKTEKEKRKEKSEEKNGKHKVKKPH